MHLGDFWHVIAAFRYYGNWRPCVFIGACVSVGVGSYRNDVEWYQRIVYIYSHMILYSDWLTVASRYRQT